jgi:hypothetical protein
MPHPPWWGPRRIAGQALELSPARVNAIPCAQRVRRGAGTRGTDLAYVSGQR